jgi:predicted permease
MFRRKRKASDFGTEIEAHLQLEAERLQEQGLCEEDARAAARRCFGNVTQARERFYESHRWLWFDHLCKDIRFAFRMLRKSPGFTAVVVLTLAFGIGANATIFSFINELLLRPPSGVAEPNRLISIWNRLPDGNVMQFSYPDYQFYRDHNRVFSNLIAFSSDPERASWTENGQSSLIFVHIVTANYFSTLGVNPFMGRAFLPNEDAHPGNDSVLILSYKFWRERLGAAPDILGKTLTLNNHAFTVVGITPRNFADLRPEFETDAWAPISMQKELSPGMDLLSDRHGYWIFVVGRLKPGVIGAQAQANLNVVANLLDRKNADPDRKGWGVVVGPNSGIDPGGRVYIVTFSALLMVLVGLVLLIACANAASLLLARASSRWREMTIRAALGAERSRILRMVLTESILVSLIAGGLGIWLSIWSGRLILMLKPSMLSFLNFDLPLDWRVIWFTAVISILTGTIFGLAPAMHCSKVDVSERLKTESIGGQQKSRFRDSLVVVQVAVCLVLVIGASLCVRSLLNARSIDPGFGVQNRLVFDFDLRILGYTDAQDRAFYSQLVDRVRALPGVRSASVTNYLPLGFESIRQRVQIEGRLPEANKWLGAGAMSVGPDYFETMGIPLLLGREFTEADSEKSLSVVIVNQEFVRRYFPGEDAIGKRISTKKDANQNPIWSEVVGVVKTGKYGSLRESPQPFLYHPFSQGFDPRAMLVVESSGDSRLQIPAVRQVIQSLDPAVLILDSQTMNDYMTLPLFFARITGVLLGVFGGLALALAMVGLYGVIAYSVAQRTREVGIRVALGANRATVLLLVIGQGLKLTLIGAAIGLVAAFVVTRLIQSLLFGISATDPVSFAAATLLLVAIACFACYWPARSAARVDPMIALRYD